MYIQKCDQNYACPRKAVTKCEVLLSINNNQWKMLPQFMNKNLD